MTGLKLNDSSRELTCLTREESLRPAAATKGLAIERRDSKDSMLYFYLSNRNEWTKNLSSKGGNTLKQRQESVVEEASAANVLYKYVYGIGRP